MKENKAQNLFFMILNFISRMFPFNIGISLPQTNHFMLEIHGNKKTPSLRSGRGSLAWEKNRREGVVIF